MSIGESGYNLHRRVVVWDPKSAQATIARPELRLRGFSTSRRSVGSAGVEWTVGHACARRYRHAPEHADRHDQIRANVPIFDFRLAR